LCPDCPGDSLGAAALCSGTPLWGTWAPLKGAEGSPQPCRGVTGGWALGLWERLLGNRCPGAGKPGLPRLCLAASPASLDHGPCPGCCPGGSGAPGHPLSHEPGTPRTPCTSTQPALLSGRRGVNIKQLIRCTDF